MLPIFTSFVFPYMLHNFKVWQSRVKVLDRYLDIQMSQLTVVSPYLLMSSVATPMPRWLFSTPIMRMLGMKNYHHVMCHVLSRAANEPSVTLLALSHWRHYAVWADGHLTMVVVKLGRWAWDGQFGWHRFTKPPIGYDLCAGTPISHLYLQCRCLFSIVS